MMPILIGAGLAIILAVVYVAFSMSRFRESAGAMEQTARELLTRLQSVEARLDETEETLAKNLTAMRREQNETAAAGRAEQARNFAVLGDAQAKRVMEIGSVQRDSFQNLHQPAERGQAGGDALDRRGKAARDAEGQRGKARKDARDRGRAASRDARKTARRSLRVGLRAARTGTQGARRDARADLRRRRFEESPLERQGARNVGRNAAPRPA